MRTLVVLLLLGAPAAIAQAPEPTPRRGELRFAAGRAVGRHEAIGEVAILSATPRFAVGLEVGGMIDDFLSFDVRNFVWPSHHEATFWAGPLVEAKTGGRVRLGVIGGIGLYQVLSHDGFGVKATTKRNYPVAYPTAPDNIEMRPRGAGGSAGILLEASATDRVAFRAQLRHHAMLLPRWEWAFAAAQAGVQVRLGKPRAAE